jgi:hypothetical protein
MQHRIAAILVVICFALGGWSCASKSNKDYEEVLMPLQTGSRIQRRIEVKAVHEKKPKTKKKKSAEAEPEAEPSPTPEEESTPPADRFR